jgi:hypothetical protein
MKLYDDEVSLIEVASFVVRRRLFIVLPAILGVLLTLPWKRVPWFHDPLTQ